MPGLALRWSDDSGNADLALNALGDDLASGGDLEAGTLLSLFLDRRAEDDDPLPAEDGDRRGWWADQFLEDGGDRIGSRRWLLDRAKRLPDTSKRYEEYDREALAWMLEDGVASRIASSYEVREQEAQAALTFHRSGHQPVTLRFAWVWEEVGA